ncbi:MAG: AAA family ATPase [Acidobacteriota bacterium]|nr:AAA family ATPase [Acidobacteriota bacterium]
MSAVNPNKPAAVKARLAFNAAMVMLEALGSDPKFSEASSRVLGACDQLQRIDHSRGRRGRSVSEPRVLPHDLDAERSVLGAVLIDDSLFPTVAEILEPKDFFRIGHQRTYECQMGLHRKGQPIDLRLLAESLERNGFLDEAGGQAYLGSLVDCIPRAANAKYYAEIVKEKSRLRELAGKLTGFVDATYAQTAPAAEIISGLDDFARQSNTTAAASVLTIVDERELGSICHAPMLIAGVLSADVNFLVGAPGAGKTTLAYSMAVSVAAGLPWFGNDVIEPGPVLFMLGEGKGSSDARLRAAKLNAGLDPDAAAGIKFIPHTVQLFERGPAYAATRRYIADAGIRLFVIDNFSLVIAGADENSAPETTAAISAARDFGCPVLLIHHMDKSNKSERGSSAIRANLDVMLSLIDTDDLITLKVEKIRDGVEIAPMALKLVEYPAAGACSIRPAADVHQTGELSKNQYAALEALYNTFGESASASRAEWLALTPTIKDRTAYHAFTRLVALGFVGESKGRFTALRPPPPRTENRVLQGSDRFAKPLQGALQGAPQSLRNAKQAQIPVLQGSAMPLQSKLQGGPGGSLEPSGTLQKTRVIPADATGGSRRVQL